MPNRKSGGRGPRDKGAQYERDVANAAKDRGLEAARTAALQAGGQVPGAGDVALFDWPELHLECKRDERMSVDAMVRQAEENARADQTPVVVYRRNRQPSRVVVPLEFLLDLLLRVGRS